VEDLAETFPTLIKNIHALFVSGMPGVGKSWTVWAWVIEQYLANKSLLWIHVVRFINGDHVCLKLDPKTGRIKKLSSSNMDDLVNYARESEQDIVIIDGVYGAIDKHKDLVVAALPQITTLSTRRTVVVASLAFDHKYMEEIGSNFNIEIFKMSPWTLSEYELACDNYNLFESIKMNLDAVTEQEIINRDCYINAQNTVEKSKILRDELLKEKYYYAGMSARWMFGKTTKRVTQLIKTIINSFDMVNREGQFSAGDSSSTCSNSLSCQFTKNNGDVYRLFVSDYVTRMMARFKSSSDMILPLYLAAKYLKSSALNGIAFEFEFIHRCANKKAIRLNYKKPGGGYRQEILNFDLVHTDLLTITKKDDGDLAEMIAGCWIQPPNNQPAFDVSRLTRAN
jgi:nucleoside-triphosphatase THEP1